LASADQQTPKSKYTAERGWPGAFDGETVNRRSFMTGVALAGGGAATMMIALPALGFALGPVFEPAVENWEDVGATDDFTTATYIPKVITIVSGIGAAGKTTVYMRTNPKPTKKEPFIAMSTRCVHLGCPVRFVAAAKQFICPCHGGTYNYEGEVTGGPPVRPLDRFYTRVRNGRVEVGPRFSVNSKLEEVSPRDPGEPVDGIWQYIYPPRPTT
jgi:Rieske Fe-S protein